MTDDIIRRLREAVAAERTIHGSWVADLLDENERLRTELTAQAQQAITDHAQHHEEIERLRAENESLAADARRYRWLRKVNPYLLLQIAWSRSESARQIGGECDAAIDAAMAAEKDAVDR